MRNNLQSCTIIIFINWMPLHTKSLLARLIFLEGSGKNESVGFQRESTFFLFCRIMLEARREAFFLKSPGESEPVWKRRNLDP
jgi:hypothetical protein